MDKTYQPHAIETSWYNTWESENYFAPQGAGESYTIMIPPPNVTGSLHMGHGFNNAIMDALIRFRRMQGRNTCLLYTSPSPRDQRGSRMPSSA